MNGIKMQRKGRRSLMRILMRKRRKTVLLKWVGRPSVSNMVFVRYYRCYFTSSDYKVSGAVYNQAHTFTTN